MTEYLDPTWAPLDEWVTKTLDGWDAILPRHLTLELDHNSLLLKAAELQTPHSLRDVLVRYQYVMRPIRKYVPMNCSEEEDVMLTKHQELYPSEERQLLGVGV